LNVRQAQKEATRQRVLDAARDLFETVGYEETTVREIARQAGVAVGSVFTCFASKADVLSQVMAERICAVRRSIASARSSPCTTPSRRGALSCSWLTSQPPTPGGRDRPRRPTAEIRVCAA